MTQKLSVLGSTGSIGTQALQVAQKQGIEIEALSAASNEKALEAQIRRFRPKKAALINEEAARSLSVSVADTGTKVLSGLKGVCECASDSEADTVLNAIVGMAGLFPTLDAIEAGKDIALANKETLVAGGELVMRAAAEKKLKILPVDSEHSAIFQCLEGGRSRRFLKKIILTASGGPFFGRTRKELEGVRLKEALKHPNWSMGAKITVDSATMMNKGLEIIEACHLFAVPESLIEVVVHRESIIHSAVEFEDNCVIAQLGLPDMKLPIQYALSYPQRLEAVTEELSLTKLGTLSFFEPDCDTFECLAVCREAARRGGLYPAAANSANEQANLLFREEKIGFLRIGELVAEVTESCGRSGAFSLSDIVETDRLARELVLQKANN